MAVKYERVQMLLEPEQRRSLADIARRKGVSVAEITRQAIDLGLEAIQKEDVSAAGRLLNGQHALGKNRLTMASTWRPQRK